MTPDRLTEIEARYGAATEWIQRSDRAFMQKIVRVSTNDIPALIAEIRRLQPIQDKAEAVYCLVEYHSEDSVLVPREAVRALGNVLEGALEVEATR